jgi:5-formyltetrahydrofolate cyclo-ligase
MNEVHAKERIRKEQLEKRELLFIEEIVRRSVLIERHFMRTDAYLSAKRLGLYAGFRNEVRTAEIFFEAREAGKEIFFPKVVDEAIVFFRVLHPSDLQKGEHGVLEPTGEVAEAGKEADLGSFDCIVVPGVAFDLRGMRLGYGKGYYDRVLKDVRCPIIALAFDLQVVNKVPSEPHDVMMGSIITESGAIV